MIEDFFDRPRLLKFRHLVFDSIKMFSGQALRMLFFGGNGWIDIQMVTNETWIHSQGFLGIPR